jgi:hypothetical protein
MRQKACSWLFLTALLFSALVLPVWAQAMPPGGPGEGGGNIYEGARSMYNKDGDLDARIENYMAKVRKGSVSYEETKERLESYIQEAKTRLRSWRNNYSSSQGSQIFQAVDSMLLLQADRCRELYDATAYEQSRGYEAAKSKWQVELETYNTYKSAVKKVKRFI